MQKQECTDSFPLEEKNVSIASQTLTALSPIPGVGTKAQVLICDLFPLVTMY